MQDIVRRHLYLPHKAIRTPNLALQILRATRCISLWHIHLRAMEFLPACTHNMA